MKGRVAMQVSVPRGDAGTDYWKGFVCTDRKAVLLKNDKTEITAIKKLSDGVFTCDRGAEGIEIIAPDEIQLVSLALIVSIYHATAIAG
jgi:hypothetical protein